jgi:hypothetical protein
MKSMVAHIYATTLLTLDNVATLEMISVPAASHHVYSIPALERMLGIELKRWEPLYQSASEFVSGGASPSPALSGPVAIATEVEQMLWDVFGDVISPAHMQQLIGDMRTVPLIPVEQSSPTLQTLPNLEAAGAAGAAAAALLTGVSVIGPVALLVLPAGVFLWFVARPAGEGVGGYIKRVLGAKGPQERQSAEAASTEAGGQSAVEGTT